MNWNTRGHIIVGLWTALALFLAIGVWGAWATLAGAVVASGQVAVEARSQVVQHPDGGVVRSVLVAEGDPVEKDQTLLILDDAELLSQKTIVAGQLLELKARATRLQAERDGLTSLTFPKDLAALGPSDDVTETIEGQKSFFAARAATQEEASRSYSEQRLQVQNEIVGQRSQLQSLWRQVELIAFELENAETLQKKGLVEAARVTALQREQARLLGLQGETEAGIARNSGRIAQLDIELLQLRATRREEAVGELRDVQGKIAELAEQLRAVDTKLSRLDLRAPMAGILHDLKIHTIGSVIRPAEPVLFVIPQGTALTVLAKVDVYHIDSVYTGQEAVLRFSSFDARTTPEVAARVMRVSPDITVDERTGAQFYTVELHGEQGTDTANADTQLLPGMPVEVFIQTGKRSPLSYLLKPFTDYFERAFRE